MPELAQAIVGIIVGCAICGSIGYQIAKDQGRRPLTGFLIGAVLPVIGVGILLMLDSKKKKK